MGRMNDIFALYPETITMAAGTSCIIQAIPGQLSVTLKYGSGGTLYFRGSSQSFGCSYTTIQRYPIGTSEVFNFSGAGQFSVEVQGATTIFHIVRSQSAGFSQT